VLGCPAADASELMAGPSAAAALPPTPAAAFWPGASPTAGAAKTAGGSCVLGCPAADASELMACPSAAASADAASDGGPDVFGISSGGSPCVYAAPSASAG
jgi:hypothetical protein